MNSIAPVDETDTNLPINSSHQFDAGLIESTRSAFYFIFFQSFHISNEIERLVNIFFSCYLLRKKEKERKRNEKESELKDFIDIIDVIRDSLLHVLGTNSTAAINYTRVSVILARPPPSVGEIGSRMRLIIDLFIFETLSRVASAI